MKIKCVYILLLYLLSSLYSLSQMNNLQYEEISTSNGLSNDDIVQILQDKRGMIWFSTSDGLNSYDGYEIKTYKGPIGREMTRDVHNARISPNDEIYLFNGKGTFIFNTLTKKFKVYKEPEELAKNWQRVDDIIFNDDGGQWLFSNKKPNINYFKDGKITSYECYALDIDGIRGFKDSKGNIWVYSCYVGLYESDWNYPSYAGLYKFDAIRKRVDTIDFTPFGATNRISTLIEDDKGNIWACGWYWGAMLITGGDIKMGKIDGHLFTPKNLTPIMQSEEFFPRSVEFDPWRNCVHIGKSRGYTTIKIPQNNTDSFKITEHVPDFNTAEGLHANTITNFFTDREGILWLGSKAEGVQKLDYKKRKFIPVSAKDFINLRFANVYSIFPFAGNKYLVGMETANWGSMTLPRIKLPRTLNTKCYNPSTKDT